MLTIANTTRPSGLIHPRLRLATPLLPIQLVDFRAGGFLLKVTQAWKLIIMPETPPFDWRTACAMTHE